MSKAPWLLSALLLAAATGGCLGAEPRPAAPDSDRLPPGWDDRIPEASALADVPFYDLVRSTSFVLKGQEYGRFIVRVPETLEGTRIFFTTGQPSEGFGPAEPIAPSKVDQDADGYHFQFLQVRPLGREVRTANVDARAEFGHAEVADVYTLTYIYGRGANHPFLAPFKGNPYDWRFEAGFYEFVLATDQRLTVAINVHTGSAFWSSRYNPQELGGARAESLHYHAEVIESVGGKLPSVDMGHGDLLRARAGERLHYFAFADVWYATTGFALDAAGMAKVTVAGAETPHRLGVSTPGPGKAEAFAFAVHYNAPGPVKVPVQVRTTFQESLSAQSTLGVLTFIFAVATQAHETHPGVADLPA